MKLHLKLSALVCLIGLSANAQPYGEVDYMRPNSEISAGLVTTINAPGFLMASTENAPSVSGFHFTIDKTSSGGLLVTVPGEISRHYAVSEPQSNCGSILPAANIYGVSVIETTGPAGEAYAVTGATDRGCFFVTLNQTGNVITQQFFEFSTSSNPTNITKPLIVESAINPNTYYICGSYNQFITYAFEVQINGTLGWTNLYMSTTSTYFKPVAIFESPYALTPEVRIFGNFDNGGANGIYMLSLGGGGAVTSCASYGTNIFNGEVADVQIAPDPVAHVSYAPAGNGGGYIMTGKFNGIPQFNFFLLKVNDAGNISFSYIKRMQDPWGNIIMTPYRGDKVLARFSPTYGYHYFTICNTTAGIIGSSFGQHGGFLFFPNDNYYKLNGLSKGLAFSQLDNGAANDQGLHIYGTEPSTNNNFLVQTYFNGYANCNDINAGGGTSSTASWFGASNLTVNSIPGLNGCSNVMIAQIGNIMIPNVICSSNTIPSGSNLRTSADAGPPVEIKSETITESGQTFVKQTAIKKSNLATTNGLQLYPNPSSGKTSVSYSLSEDSQVQIRLLNTTGQVVHAKTQLSRGGENTAELNFAEMNLPGGMYILQLTVNGITEQQKVIYGK